MGVHYSCVPSCLTRSVFAWDEAEDGQAEVPYGGTRSRHSGCFPAGLDPGGGDIVAESPQATDEEEREEVEVAETPPALTRQECEAVVTSGGVRYTVGGADVLGGGPPRAGFVPWMARRPLLSVRPTAGCRTTKGY